MKKIKLYNVVAHAIFSFVKHKDENAILYFSKKLTEDFSKEEFNDLMIYFFNFYKDSLEEDDYIFFQQVTENFIDLIKKQVSEKTIDEEKHLKKIKKGVAFFEKIGFRLGVDYSFKNGNFYMSKKNKLRLKAIMER